MSIKALRTLLAIARQGSFAAAGTAIGLTPSAVRLQIRGLGVRRETVEAAFLRVIGEAPAKEAQS